MTMPATDPKALVAAFARTQKFPLDPFQIEAMEALASGRSVLVSAPTGSGKTVVAEFAVFLALESKTRCIYTTPLKALSNQKYRDLKAALPGQVGLITGDVVLEPEAPVLIMTTEILRNILHADPTRVEDVSHVVLDEAHYLGSEGRGTVWEETIVFLNKHTSVTALSATIPNAEELATWVGTVHKPMQVVYHAERPVPLESYVASPNVKKLFTSTGKLAVKRFGDDEGWVAPPEPVEVVKDLQNKEMLPAIYFVFSRLGCEEQARDVINADLMLTTPEERKRIRHMVEAAVRQTPGMLGSHATKKWLDLLPYGVAPHHAGLLPPLKYLIERLFQRALIKVVFATETLAAGINMPARTVVLSSVIKRTDEGHRVLTVSEFQQMMGRAGRRGMDEVGYGVVVSSHRYSPMEIGHLATSQAEPLKSRFALNFNMVANLTHRYEPDQARKIVEQSFAQFQSSGAVASLFDRKRRTQERLEALDERCPFDEAKERVDLLDRLKLLRNDRESLRKRLAGMESSRQYTSRQSATSQLLKASFGSWVLVHPPGATSPELGVLLDVQTVKSGDVHYSVLLETPSITRLGGRHLVMVLPGEPVTTIPEEVVVKAGRISYLQQHTPGDYRPTWHEWIERSGLDLEAMVKPITEPPEIFKAKAKLKEVTQELERFPCSSCKVRKACQESVRDRRILGQEIGRFNKEIDVLHSNHWRGFLKLVRFLEETGFLRGRELLARGQALTSVRTTNELVAAEALASGMLEGLEPVKLAAATSALVAEPVRGRQSWRGLKFDPELHILFERLAKDAKRLAKRMLELEIEQPIYLVPDYVGLTQAWAEGLEWGPIIEASGIDEGQLVRHLRQVIDMLQQFREIPGLGETFRARAREAAELLDRDIVKEVF
ncbi:DEAD/DEAH box helicase [bacterium]|nr:DEAD/DEAH box helicase [bacterium]